MKNLLSIFGNFTLIFAAVVCTLGALISAFSFHVDGTIVIFVWIIASLAIALNFAFWRIKGLLILLVPTLALFIWRMPQILDGARWVINYITTEYSRWLYVTVLFPDAEAYAYELTLFFTAAGVALSFLLSVAICLRRSALLTILFTVPIVALTFVIIFNYSEPLFLMGLLAVYLTIIISNGLSPDSFVNRSFAVFPAFLMALILMGATFVASPPGDYSRGDAIRSIDHQIRAVASRLGIARLKMGVGWPVVYDERWGFNTDVVGISEAGTRIIHDVSVLEVMVDTPGVFYLRGYSMQYFDGSAWTVNSDAMQHYTHDWLARAAPALISIAYGIAFPEVSTPPAGISIYVTGDVTRGITYTPYFALPHVFLSSPYYFAFQKVEESILRLHERLPQELQFPNFALAGAATSMDEVNASINSRATYLQIDDSSAALLRAHAVDVIGINPYDSRENIANQVAAFMVGFGTYTLAPFVIPAHEDFVMFFLNISRQGYCIHYATAATMMLRALDVPARFTSGFVVTVMPHETNETIVITDRYAHAWVEVFFDDIGWLPFEVTPPATGFGPGDGRPGAGVPNPFSPAGHFFPEDEFLYIDWWDEFELGHDMGFDDFAQFGAPAPHADSAVRWVLIGAIVLVLILAPLVHRGVASQKRAQRFAQEDGNAAVVFAWRYLGKLSRFRRWDKLPEGIEDIAMKARFSQHRISSQERSAVVEYAVEFAEKVYEFSNPLEKFWVKFIRGL
ncbi:MAG: transglutaminase-like domain-containing protein [Oscillospiraceae bacterium]|nr:transglutaminase-like domain-containing protein [Oscillospiraceae bacterium]